MGWFRRNSWFGVGAAWTYLLRVMTRGFLGELGLGVLGVGKRFGRRLRLAARLVSPGMGASHRRRKRSRRVQSMVEREPIDPRLTAPPRGRKAPFDSSHPR